MWMILKNQVGKLTGGSENTQNIILLIFRKYRHLKDVETNLAIIKYAVKIDVLPTKKS